MRFSPLLFLALSACFQNAIDSAHDRDGDGFDNAELGGEDCDDDNPLVNPSSPEVCGDNVDNNCDGVIDDDGVGSEVWFLDADGDGYAADVANEGCSAPEDSLPDLSAGVDCDDLDSSSNPGAMEACGDDVDNNCNGIVDSDAENNITWYVDVDDDDFPSDEPVYGCTAPAGSHPDLSNGVDCDDTEFDIRPNATEVCGDNRDNDCDGETDDHGIGEITWYEDADADGFPTALPHFACEIPVRQFGNLDSGVDCNDQDSSIRPDATETWYDGIDQNCDGADDYDQDGDGVSSDAYTGGTDCDDTSADVHPGATEICNNGLDDDCSGDAPECVWESGLDIGEAAGTVITGVSGNYVTPLLATADFTGDGLPDLVETVGFVGLELYAAPLARGVFSTGAISSVSYSGSWGPLDNVGMGLSVVETLGGEILVGGMANSGEIWSFSGPFLGSGSPHSHSSVFVTAPQGSRFGRSVASGVGFGAGGQLGVAILQGARASNVSTGWDAGVHIWPNGLPSPSASVNSAPLQIATAASYEWSDMRVVDVDGDGADDIVVVGEGRSLGGGIIAIHYAPFGASESLGYAARISMDGQFNLSISGGAQFNAVTFDSDGDGRLEIALWGETNVYLAEIPTAGGVSATSGRALQMPLWADQNVPLASGDFNGDGHADLVVASYGSTQRELSWYLGPLSTSSGVGLAPNGTSALPLALTTEMEHYQVMDAVVGDFDADGLDDLSLVYGDNIYVIYGRGR